MGIAGAGLASSIAEGVGIIFLFAYAKWRNDILHLVNRVCGCRRSLSAHKESREIKIAAKIFPLNAAAVCAGE